VRVVAFALHSARWPPDVAQHRGRAGARRQRELSDLFQPYGGFPDGVRVQQGYITMPELAGIGFEGKSDLYAEMKRLAE
jgi:hypothetical protein